MVLYMIETDKEYRKDCDKHSKELHFYKESSV